MLNLFILDKRVWIARVTYFVNILCYILLHIKVKLFLI